MPPAPYGAYGFCDYSFSEQMMIMPQGAAYYNQVGPYPDLYSQQYNYPQDQYLQNYPQQPFDGSMTAYTMHYVYFPPKSWFFLPPNFFSMIGLKMVWYGCGNIEKWENQLISADFGYYGLQTEFL